MTSSVTSSSITNVIARKLDAIQEKSAMKSVDIANLLGARPETVSRWNQGKAFPRVEFQKILLDLEYVVDLLSDFFEPQEARLWLFSRQRLLEGETPAELIQRGQTKKVMTVIDQLLEGVYL